VIPPTSDCLPAGTYIIAGRGEKGHPRVSILRAWKEQLFYEGRPERLLRPNQARCLLGPVARNKDQEGLVGTQDSKKGRKVVE